MTARCSASTSVPLSSGSGSGRTRALRNGSVCSRFEQRDALDALDDHLDAALAAGHLLDDGAGADGVQVVEAGLLVVVVALGDDDERLLLGGQHRLDGRQRAAAGPPPAA